MKRRCTIIAKRKKQLTVRFTEEEYAALKGKCEIAGMKMEPFVRALVEGCRIKPAPPDSYNKLRQQFEPVDPHCKCNRPNKCFTVGQGAKPTGRYVALCEG